MNALDVAILIAIGGFALYGIWRGMIRLVLGFVAFALGIVLAAWFNAPLGARIGGWIESEAGRRLLAAALIFGATVIGFTLLAWLIRRMLEPAKLLWADRAAGAIAGAAMGVLLAAAAMVPLTALLPADSAIIRESKLAPHVLAISSYLKGLVPEEMKKRYEESRERLRQTGESALPRAK